MKRLVKVIAGLGVLIAIAGLGVWAIGAQQPSRAIHQYDQAIVVALKAAQGETAEGDRPSVEGTLWSARASHILVGDTEAYWTDFLILRPDTGAIPALRDDPAYDDVYAAQVELADIPSLALGLLRAQHLAGITQRSEGALADAFEEVSERPDIMPTQASLKATLALGPDQSVTMMNFLEYVADEAGDKEDGRRVYRRYGAEAMKAVHAVGGQLLFAGKVTRVLIAPKGSNSPEGTDAPSTPVEWDDLAAMIYPDPSAIFAMEQNEAYVASLSDRDASLKNTQVIVSLAD